MLLQSRRLLIALLFILQLCTSQSFSQSLIDSTIVLRAGNVSFTGYELQKNLTIFKDTLRQRNGREPSNEETDKWIQSFIDRAYLLADAWDKGYDTLAETQRWVAAMERFIISQPGGLLDEKLGGTLTEQELADAIQKHLRKLHYRYVRFPDHGTAFTMLDGNSTVKTNAEFESLIKKISANQNISKGQDISQWPFYRRGEREELILSLKEGEISSLITLSDGVYLAQATRIEITDTTQLPPNFRQMLTAILKQRKTEQLHRSFYEESVRQAAIKYDETVLTILKDYLAHKGTISSFEKEMFPAIRQNTAITYQLGNSTKQISADRWMSYYNELPMRQAINKDNLHGYLESIVIEDYAFEKARQTGITNDLKFVLDKNNYTKNVAFVIYEREELKKGITATDQEIAAKYQQTKNEYAQSTDAVITAFSFPDRRGASMGYMAIRNNRIDSLIKTNAIESHRSIKYNEPIFTDSIRNVIFSMKSNQSSPPVFYKGSWLLLIKEAESGNRIRELEEVKPIIIKRIEEEKLEQKKKLLLETLKKKYTVRNDINYARYHK